MDANKEAAAESSVADMILGPEQEAEVEQDDIDISEPIDDEEYVEAEALEEEAEDLGLEEYEFDGVVYEVPPVLKEALMRQSDYTHKTQTLAEERKQVEVVRKQVEVQQQEQKFIQDIQPELNNIGYLQAHIQQAEKELQSNLSNMTSEQMFKKKIELDGYKEQLNALSQGLQSKYKEFEEAQKQSYQELLEQGAQVLKKAIPNWSEEKQAAIRDYALSKGFSPQEVSAIIDPRHVQILYAAQQYEELQKKARPAADKAKAAPKIQPKARQQMPNDVRAKLDLKNKLKSNKLSANQKAKLIAEDFGRRFG